MAASGAGAEPLFPRHGDDGRRASRSRHFLNVVILATLVILTIAGLGFCLYVAWAPDGHSSSRWLPAPPPQVLSINGTGPVYAGADIWYNFIVTPYFGNLTWQLLRFWVSPGPLTRSETNWTLDSMNASSVPIASYIDSSGNWSTASNAPVLPGEVVSLKVDSPLALGVFWVEWPIFGGGETGVELS
jgi:hypothetical protein